MYLNFNKFCKFVKIEELIVRTVEPSLTIPAHEKADSKIVFYATNIQKKDAKVVIRCSDTDV